MTYPRLAIKATLILLAMAPLAAAAQADNRPYIEAMDRVTNKRPVNPARPGDKDYDCARIRAELAKLERQLAGGMGSLNANAGDNYRANQAEMADRRKLAQARDAANLVAPAGTAPGNLIEAVGLIAVEHERAIQQADNVVLAAKLGNDFNFIAARIPYLHKLAEKRCTAEDLGDEGKVGK